MSYQSSHFYNTAWFVSGITTCNQMK